MISVTQAAGHHYHNPQETDLSMRFVSRDVIYHSAKELPKTYETWVEAHHKLLKAFDILNPVVLHQVTEGDTVITHWASEGRHKGAFLGVPATGKIVQMRGVGIDRVKDGLVSEHWGLNDGLGLAFQLGASLKLPES